MNRRGWIALGAAVALFGGGWLFLRTPYEPVPLAWLSPADALLYAEIPGMAFVDRLPKEWTGPFRARLDEARPHLAGPMAVYLDREGEWVFLATLTRGASLFGGAAVIDGVAVAAQSPAALERHRARKGRLPLHAGSGCYANLDALKLPGRLRDYGAVAFEIDPGPPVVLRGVAAYRGGLFRLFLEHYLQAPKPAGPADGPPVSAILTEHFPRVWDEIVHDLPLPDRERLEREATALSRDFLNGRGVREFLGRLGPTWGVSIVPTPHGMPAATGWIELADRETGATFARMLHRTAHDVDKYARDQGRAPSWELAVDGDAWRLKIADPVLQRLGPAFAPAFRFEGTRLLFTTCADAFLQPPPPAEGTHHSTISVELGSAFEAVRKYVPYAVDRAFRAEAETKSGALYDRMYTAESVALLRRRFPEEHALIRHLAAQRVQLTATALADLSRTPRYEEELRRILSRIDALESSLKGIGRATFAGRFRADGLHFEVMIK